ncbi:MAG TPA: glycosyltransferase [Thermomicrobiales bacterium]|nr:glycosyltransferase [Thermomicrobiales bacterium]
MPADGSPPTEPLWMTVLMPVYNGERYIREAIDSILVQTHPHFEFLIINDGSTDSTPAILDDYAARDPRVRVIHQANIDQPATLNRGLLEARHDWVAIIDHDDISRPQRLERQALTLAQNPGVRVVGTYGVEITSEGTEFGLIAFGPTSVSDYHTRRRRNEWMSFIHASVVVHRPTILALGGYRASFGSAADSDLWSRVADDHPVIVVPEYLVEYRVHLGSMSFKRFFEQQRVVRLIRACQGARRSGQPEPTLAEMTVNERGPLYLGQLNNRRFDSMMYCLRRRRLFRFEGKAVPAATYFILASALDPIRAARRIAGRFSPHEEAPIQRTTPIAR